MSPRLTSRITGRSYSWAHLMTAPSARQPAAPYCSKKAACGLTQAATSATASMTPLQNSWKQAATAASSPSSAACGRYFSTRSRGMRSSDRVQADADDAASRADGRGQSVGEVLHGGPLRVERAHRIARSRARTAAGVAPRSLRRRRRSPGASAPGRPAAPSSTLVAARTACAWNWRTLRRMVAILART